MDEDDVKDDLCDLVYDEYANRHMHIYPLMDRGISDGEASEVVMLASEVLRENE